MSSHFSPVPRALGGAIDDQALAHITDQCLAWQDGQILDPTTRHLLKISVGPLLMELCQHRQRAEQLQLPAGK